jgi:hypothetical protein
MWQQLPQSYCVRHCLSKSNSVQSLARTVGRFSQRCAQCLEAARGGGASERLVDGIRLRLAYYTYITHLSVFAGPLVGWLPQGAHEAPRRHGLLRAGRAADRFLGVSDWPAGAPRNMTEHIHSITLQIHVICPQCMDGAVLVFLRVGMCTEGAGISCACMYTGRWGSPSNPMYLYRGGGVAPPTH